MEKIFLAAFRGIGESEYRSLRASGFIRGKTFEKGEIVFSAGDYVTELGLVCSGSLHIESCDFWGNKSILSVMGPGQVFAVTYALCHEPLMVDAVSAEETSVIFLDLQRASDISQAGQSWYPKLQKNLLMMAVRKNLTLSERILCTAPKTIRGRLLTYLSGQAARNGGNEFDIPFNRQELADYLNVERSALSKELGRMKNERLIDCRRNHFKFVEN